MKRLLNLQYPFAHTCFFKTKWRRCQAFERHYVATTSYIRVQCFRERKHRRNDQLRTQRPPV